MAVPRSMRPFVEGTEAQADAVARLRGELESLADTAGRVTAQASRLPPPPPLIPGTLFSPTGAPLAPSRGTGGGGGGTQRTNLAPGFGANEMPPLVAGLLEVLGFRRTSFPLRSSSSAGGGGGGGVDRRQDFVAFGGQGSLLHSNNNAGPTPRGPNQPGRAGASSVTPGESAIIGRLDRVAAGIDRLSRGDGGAGVRQRGGL